MLLFINDEPRLKEMEKKIGYNNDLLRSKNRGQVFEQLVTHEGIYRMDLVEQCGLTKMSISNIINEFLEKNIAIETLKSEDRRPGRKSTLLQLAPEMKKIIGLMIHRRFVSVALCDCRLNIVRSNTIHFNECNLGSLLEKIFMLIDEIKEGYDILGIGVGSIGPVNVEKGIILNPTKFYNIENVPIVQLLQERYKLPVYLDYHFNCAARSEKYFGLANKYRNFILLGISDGVGISVVVDGKILTRMTEVSSEFGHVTVDYKGKKCSCGRRGCLGEYIDFTTETSTWESVRIMSTALMGVCDILLPEALVIRDEFSYLNQEHIDWLNEELNQKIVTGGYRKIKVYKTELGQQIEAVGCVTNILGRVFSGEIEM